MLEAGVWAVGTSFLASSSHVRRTLAISCEGRTTLPWLTITVPTIALQIASNRPSSAASRCSTARPSYGSSRNEGVIAVPLFSIAHTGQIDASD
jgi:hypothetical protein